jgi:hypothetical protein
MREKVVQKLSKSGCQNIISLNFFYKESIQNGTGHQPPKQQIQNYQNLFHGMGEIIGGAIREISVISLINTRVF